MLKTNLILPLRRRYSWANRWANKNVFRSRRSRSYPTQQLSHSDSEFHTAGLVAEAKAREPNVLQRTHVTVSWRTAPGRRWRCTDRQRRRPGRIDQRGTLLLDHVDNGERSQQACTSVFTRWGTVIVTVRDRPEYEQERHTNRNRFKTFIGK